MLLEILSCKFLKELPLAVKSLIANVPLLIFVFVHVFFSLPHNWLHLRLSLLHLLQYHMLVHRAFMPLPS